MSLDYAAPATPGEVLRDLAAQYDWRAKEARRVAEDHIKAASLWDEAAHQARVEADSFDRWQPIPAPPVTDTEAGRDA